MLFYDAAAGEGQFYTTGGGDVSLIGTGTGWRHTWQAIIPGRFA